KLGKLDALRKKIRDNKRLFYIVMVVFMILLYSVSWFYIVITPCVYQRVKTVKEVWNDAPPIFIYWGSVEWAYPVTTRDDYEYVDLWTRIIFGNHSSALNRIENLFSEELNATTKRGNFIHAMVNDTPIVVIREFYYPPLPMPPLKEYGIIQMAENTYRINATILNSYRNNWTIYVLPITDLINASGVMYVYPVKWNLSGYEIWHTIMFLTSSIGEYKFAVPRILPGENVSIEAHIELRHTPLCNVTFTIEIGEEALPIQTNKSEVVYLHLTAVEDMNWITLRAETICEVEFTVYFKINFDLQKLAP
ncbi:MAG: hypothetical protein QXS54_13180, partial [Candidatus Methanomethylicaceae archaeon]